MYPPLRRDSDRGVDAESTADAPIRTITIGVAEPHPLPPEVIERAAIQARRVEAGFTDAGHVVQTVRLSTRSVFDDLADWPAAKLISYARELQLVLDRLGLEFLSLGAACAARPGFPLDRVFLIEQLLVAAPAVSCSVQLATPEAGIRIEAVPAVAQVMRQLAEHTDGGLGNFRFAALACVEAGHPFFPASYHAGPPAVAIGLQGAGILARQLSASAPLDPDAITRGVREALIIQATPAVRLAERIAQQLGLHFSGIDLSPAPGGTDSIVAAIESCLAQSIGSPGTLAVVGAITEAIRTTGLPTCGYNGLMLPVLEDTVLARRWAERALTVHQLLSYSAVCGTGLDTVPLPGDIPAEQIAALLLDMATMAVRLRKPLSARLFPVPGTRSGDRTRFASPYLVNTLLQ